MFNVSGTEDCNDATRDVDAAVPDDESASEALGHLVALIEGEHRQ